MDETIKMWKKRAVRKQAGPVLRKWFVISGPVRMSRYCLQLGALSQRLRIGKLWRSIILIAGFPEGAAHKKGASFIIL